MLLTVGEIIKRTINLYRENFNLFITYMVILFIPTGITTILATMIDDFAQRQTAVGSISLGIYLIILVLSWIASLWIGITFMRVLYKKYEGQSVKNPKMELQSVGHLLIPALLVSILSSLIIFAGFILFIIPGIIFAVWLAFSVYYVAIEEKKVIDSLKASKALVKDRWFAVLWRLIAPLIVFGLVLLIVNGLLGGSLGMILAAFESETFMYKFMNTIIALTLSFVSLLFTPLTSGATIILFSELQKAPTIPKLVKKAQTK